MVREALRLYFGARRGKSVLPVAMPNEIEERTHAEHRPWDGDVAVSDLKLAGLPIASIVRAAKIEPGWLLGNFADLELNEMHSNQLNIDPSPHDRGGALQA